jgi:pimeloyl-ACP methyl ester carboxylesterase
MSTMSSGSTTSSGSATVFGTAALAARYADDLLLGAARDVHGAIARRVWGPLNAGTRSAARPPQKVHDAISKAVYGGVSAGLRGSARACEAADRRDLGPRIDATPAGRRVVSTVNGLIGDRLVEEAPGAAVAMAIRVGGADVPLERTALAGAFPDATGDLVVFVHGLMEHDEHWFRRVDELPSYGDQLAASGSWTPVYLRANTGLSLGANGVALASLLDGVMERWPVPVRRIALVGHSMGGLIIRAACAVSTDAAEPWNRLVTNVVCLGTPHLGAPLERLVALGSRALGVLPESAPFGRILDHRSVGILNLRHGLAADVQNLPHARYSLVYATLGPTVWHPLSLGLGDLLVRHPSALGRSRNGEMFPGADTLHLPSATHFDLLNHPEIHRKLKEWLV